jgi:hypothetical protein
MNEQRNPLHGNTVIQMAQHNVRPSRDPETITAEAMRIVDERTAREKLQWDWAGVAIWACGIGLVVFWLVYAALRIGGSGE